MLVWLYPLLFFLFDRKTHRLSLRRRDWMIYGLVMAAAVFFCVCARNNIALPNPINGLAKLIGE